MTKIYGILGDPNSVKNSLSPQMQNAAFKERGISARYLRFPVSSPKLKNFLRENRGKIAGLSVTKPFKEKIIPYLDEIDPLASKIGAVNTVVVEKKGRWKGWNTDYYGILEALKKTKVPLKNKKAVILGAGGTARALTYALKKSGFRITILNRTIAKAQKLAQKFTCQFGSLADLEKIDYDLLINATSVKNQLLIPESHLKSSPKVQKVYLEINYPETISEKAAKKAGFKIIPGKKILLYQGIRQFEFWTGKRAPLKVMKQALGSL